MHQTNFVSRLFVFSDYGNSSVAVQPRNVSQVDFPRCHFTGLQSPLQSVATDCTQLRSGNSYSSSYTSYKRTSSQSMIFGQTRVSELNLLTVTRVETQSARANTGHARSLKLAIPPTRNRQHTGTGKRTDPQPTVHLHDGVVHLDLVESHGSGAGSRRDQPSAAKASKEQ